MQQMVTTLGKYEFHQNDIIAIITVEKKVEILMEMPKKRRFI
jgi:hypothetical protein